MPTLTTSTGGHRIRSVFKSYDFVKMYYELIFCVFENKCYRVLAVIVLLALLAYYFIAMEVFMASSPTELTSFESLEEDILEENDDIDVSCRNRSVRPEKTLTSQLKHESATKVTRKVSIRSSFRMTSSCEDLTSDTDCRMYSCFNYSRCPLTGGFPIYLYDLDTLFNDTDGVIARVRDILAINHYITTDPQEACLFLVFVDPLAHEKTKTSSKSRKINEVTLNTLPHWGDDGQNHLILNFGNGAFMKSGSAMVAQTMFTHKLFRPGFDVVLPITQRNIYGIPLKGEVWTLSTPMNLARRSILISFQGQLPTEMTPQNPKRDALVKFLQTASLEKAEIYNFHFNCKTVDNLFERGIDDWALCLEIEMRSQTLINSTFALILAPADDNYASTNLLQTRLFEALESGAVPVILGGDRIRLPFEEVLDWRRAVISLPMARVADLMFIVETTGDEDILAFRKNGRVLWERYLGSVQTTVDSVLAIIRTRLNIVPRPIQSQEFANKSAFEISLPRVNQGNRIPEIEANTFKRNFTIGLLNAYEQWNLWGDPFTLYPQLPWDPKLSPEARSLKKTEVREIRRTEQFTIVILTYKRQFMLKELIVRVSQLANLNKILVVSNSRTKLQRDDWPTTVPIVVVYPSTNSLNNRFVPLDLIETEAVFSLDDDTTNTLKKKEVKFAFKVWREHRDQIVGFFARNYEWVSVDGEEGFKYSESTPQSSNTACQVGMVLTGAAFVHRYYYWAYWRAMPGSMRGLVDRFKNCEDIAMNFLVAHITRKPPIRVWSSIAEGTGTYDRLSRNNSHYVKRTKCLRYFAQIMGYTPLLTAHFVAKPIPGKK